LASFNSKLLVYQRDPEGKVPSELYKETMKHMKKGRKNNEKMMTLDIYKTVYFYYSSEYFLLTDHNRKYFIVIIYQGHINSIIHNRL
jgi:hypothetical protein